jgi:23S rRNA pseudouridine1911/1915/1917 synthase
MKYIFCVYINESKRVDMYLSALFENFSRSYIQSIIDNKHVGVNSKIISKNIKIKNKDEININLVIESSELKAEKIDLDIIYEDDDILVINKDANINVHPVPGFL